MKPLIWKIIYFILIIATIITGTIYFTYEYNNNVINMNTIIITISILITLSIIFKIKINKETIKYNEKIKHDAITEINKNNKF